MNTFKPRNLTLLLAAIFISIGFGASLVEMSLHMSRYFANPPTSFSTWYGDQTHSVGFWIPLLLGALLLTAVATVNARGQKPRFNLLLIALVTCVAATIWNIAYFAPEVRWLLKAAQTLPLPADFAVRAHRWYLLSWLRQAIGAIPFVSLLLALSLPETTAPARTEQEPIHQPFPNPSTQRP